MRRARTRARWSAGLLGASVSLATPSVLGGSGCSHESARGLGEPRVSGPGATSATAPDDRASAPPARVGLVEGEVVLEGVPAVSGAGVEAGQAVALRNAGRLSLDLLVGARVTLFGNGAVVVAEPPDQGVWLTGGIAHVADPPGGVGTRAPLRIATPAVTVELQGAGDVVVTIEPSGATHVAVLNGRVELTTGEVDVRRRLRVTELGPATMVRVAERVEEPGPGPARLEEAIEAARAILGRASGGSPGAAVARIATARLDEAMRWLELEQRRGRDLTARHRAAVQAGRSDEAMQYQREIVAHAQAVHALRQLVITRWERVIVAARAHSRDPRTLDDEVVARRERLRNLLGS